MNIRSTLPLYFGHRNSSNRKNFKARFNIGGLGFGHMGMTFYPVRARTHLKYAQKLLAEAMEAEQLGHMAEVFKRCLDASEHALKAIFDITGIDMEKYKDLEEAVVRGLKTVFDKTTLDQLKDYYSTLKLPASGEASAREAIEKAAFLIKKAAEFIQPQ
ncbi:MAG TPA: HEPN domain-containing protein [Proteobacteria bacterium]|nr:HEPN domain-containing protein [Pseudomonadota bacterium]